MDSNTPAISPVTASYLATRTRRSLERGDVLVVLLEELVGVRLGGERHGVVVAGGATAALGVEEGRAAVRGDGEVAAELRGVALARELLQGEQGGTRSPPGSCTVTAA